MSYKEAAGDLLDVEAFAFYTSRNEEHVRRWIRNGVIKAAPHPENKRRLLIPWDQIDIAMQQPRVDKKTHKVVELRKTALTFSDGSTRTITTIPTPNKG